MATDTTQNTIRKVYEEGLEVRNLFNFISDGSMEEVGTSKKPPVSPRPQSVSPKPASLDSNKTKDPSLILRGNKRRGILSRPKSRLRSASAGRNPEKDLRARYWTFLFENLHRAVDEIYQTCEMDESIVESKEAIMMLENYSKDFHALIQYININKNYEKTDPPNRPTSLTWEVRKSSPGKSFLKNVFIEKLTAGNSNAKKILCFDPSSEFSSSDVKNLTLTTAIPGNTCSEPLDSKVRMDVVLETTSISNPLPKCSHEATMSVVSEPLDETFPCNENLIVNKVLTQENVFDDSSIKEQDQNINTSNTVIVPDDSSIREEDQKKNTSNSVIVLDDSNIGAKDQKVNSSNAIIEEQTEASIKNEADIICSELNSCDENSLACDENSYKENNPPNFVQTEASCKKDSLEKSQNSIIPSLNHNSDAKKCELKNIKNAEINESIAAKAPSPPSLKDKATSTKPELLINKGLKKATVTSSLSKKKINVAPSLQESRESCSNSILKIDRMDKTATSKSTTIPLKKVENNLSSPRPASTPISKNSFNLKSNTILKNEKQGTPAEKKKILKTNHSESAIKRNISYVQSLSSKNQSGRFEERGKKSHSRLLSDGHKVPQKSGSMSSLNQPPSSKNWTRKTSSVEKIPEVLKSNTDDDSDGWEMVRGRNRCRNSPAKKLPFSNKSHENQVAQMVELNLNRIGGFPYTTKINGKIINKNSQKVSELSKKPSQGGKNIKDNKSKNGVVNEMQIVESPEPSCNNVKEYSSSNKEGKNLINANDFHQMKLRNSSESSVRKESLRLSSDVISVLEKGKVTAKRLKGKHLKRSSSVPDIHSLHKENPYNSLSKVLCISDQYLETQKYININLLQKKLSEKSIGSVKRRGKKAQNNGDKSEKKELNGSQDESDNGLTSDDQDGPMSHDEAYDVQCQELCDTAWRYKILEQQVHKLELSWGEQMDRVDMELRTPGRALEMHEKLSSPFRKKSLYESIRVCKEKQLKAQEQRERLLVEKAKKFRLIQKKREEMKNLQEQRQEKQRILMEQKLQRAEEKRKKQLQMIIRKAHDEEEKVNEIAFINSLEAQNKRHDLISKEKDHEARLHDIQEERQRKLEEKAAKEAAAEGRRKILEAERQARLTEMQERRKMRDHKVEQLFLVKEKERQELASQKARDRELRISALNAQQQISIEELQKKIQLKQEESARRHEENMEQIRQKAFELSIRRCSSNNDDVPQPVPYETKKICSICNVLIGSEVYLLSHLHGKKHQEAVKSQYQDKDPSAEELELYNLKHIVDASTDQLDPNIALDKERQKALKKRCKKLRQRMCTRGQGYESSVLKASGTVNSASKSKMGKILNNIKKLEENSKDSNIFPALEHNLNEISSIYQKKLHQDKSSFNAIGGVTALINAFGVVTHLPMESNTVMQKKILNHLCSTFDSVIENSYDICKFILFGNKIGSLLDFFIHRLNILIPDNISQLMANQVKSNGVNIQLDATAGKLLYLLNNILNTLSAKHNFPSDIEKNNEKGSDTEDFHFRMQDVISYIVSIGIVDKLSQFFNCIQGPINNETEVASFLLDCIAFLSALIKLNSMSSSPASNRKTERFTQRGPAPPLPKQTEVLAFSTLRMLNHMAVMSLSAFQSILGSEGLSLQLRHITSHLLWYCSNFESEALLHEIILLVGYFTVLNAENQSIIQAGQRPTVLQQLCCLPFLYFT
ncbi:S phase cyclin A-associated protein in the like protein [Argiope bruennichi]|uniref:S phase cyclin A-associated protein in the like protein n=1 Tax=Argiope bruennichi TaxID=94029 RepID=A0A8T0DZZ5_ARGBR|nr:S phase cyclin A-associated protein in the like protein [Argiope bruennichi]